MQVYVPLDDTNNNEVETFYQVFDAILSLFSNRKITIILGDFNANIYDINPANYVRTTVEKYGSWRRIYGGKFYYNLLCVCVCGLCVYVDFY